jgi:hypothetical protein
MSNRRQLNDSGIPMVTVSVRRFMWTLEVNKPVLIRDSEVMDRQDVSDVMHRCMVQVSRASHQVQEKNRTVKWAVFIWQRESWREICKGVSRMKDRPVGVNPGRLE